VTAAVQNAQQSLPAASATLARDLGDIFGIELAPDVEAAENEPVHTPRVADAPKRQRNGGGNLKLTHMGSLDDLWMQALEKVRSRDPLEIGIPRVERAHLVEPQHVIVLAEPGSSAPRGVNHVLFPKSHEPQLAA